VELSCDRGKRGRKAGEEEDDDEDEPDVVRFPDRPDGVSDQLALPIARLACVSSSPLFERNMRLWEEVTDERGEKLPRELGRAAWKQTPERTG